MAQPPRKSTRARTAAPASEAPPGDKTDTGPTDDTGHEGEAGRGDAGSMPPHDIWLAGLGALANAQAEGTKAFEALVEQGLQMQARTQALAKEQWSEAAQRLAAIAGQAPGSGSWDRLGGIFEGRVARALASLGMPTAGEVAELRQRVQALEQALAALQEQPPRSKARAAPSPDADADSKSHPDA